LAPLRRPDHLVPHHRSERTAHVRHDPASSRRAGFSVLGGVNHRTGGAARPERGGRTGAPTQPRSDDNARSNHAASRSRPSASVTGAPSSRYTDTQRSGSGSARSPTTRSQAGESSNADPNHAVTSSPDDNPRHN